MASGRPLEPAPIIPMSDIVKQLEFAANENLRLRNRLEDNNRILDQKLREIQGCLDAKESEKLQLERDKEGALWQPRVCVHRMWLISGTYTLSPALISAPEA